MSVVLLVPINNRSATWTADHHPDDWRQQHQRRDRLHYARVAILIAGFVLTLVPQPSAEPGPADGKQSSLKGPFKYRLFR